MARMTELKHPLPCDSDLNRYYDTRARKCAALAAELGLQPCDIGERVAYDNQFINETDLYLVLDLTERAVELSKALDDISFDEIEGYTMSAGLLLAPYDHTEIKLVDGFFAYLLERREEPSVPPVATRKYKVFAQIERRMCIDVSVEVQATDQYAAERIARDNYVDNKLPVVHETSVYWANNAEFVVENVEEIVE